MERVSARTVEAMLTGMAEVGIDVSTIRARLATAAPPGIDDRVPRDLLAFAWEECLRQRPSSTLGAEVGLAVPRGAFGMVDHLIASAETLGDGLLELVRHHATVTDGRPVLTLVDEGAHLRLDAHAPPHPLAWIAEQFTLALTLKNLRLVVVGPDPIAELLCTVEDDGTGALSRLLRVPIRFGQPVAGIRIPASAASSPLRTADPELQRTLRSFASALGIDRPRSPIVGAVRERLGPALASGRTDAASMAAALGMSERTLHRRLHAQHTSWGELLDAFRSDESKRRLREEAGPLLQIALDLGFSDQTAWTRAFRRWNGKSPTRWRRDGGAP